MAKSTTTQFTRGRQVNMQVFSLRHKPHMFVRFEGEIRPVEMTKLSRNESGTIDCVPVTDLETGEMGTLLCLTTLKSTLERLPGSYVNHCFELVNEGDPDKKGYNQINVYEIGDPAE